MPWCEKYRPMCFLDVKGQEIIIDKIKKFIKNFEIGKKAVILYGPPGTGKTSLAKVFANETNMELFELNASDLRNREKLNQILGSVIEQKSLTKKGKIILIDEVDGISTVDRGGLAELLTLIVKTRFPIIITANDIWKKEFNPLRKICEIVQLRDLDYGTIKDILINILRKEGLFLDYELIASIAIKARGDVRAAINDLQIAANSKDKTPFMENERDKELDIFNALKRIFKNKPATDMLGIYDKVNLSLDDIFLWVEENIPTEYKNEELAKAFESVSKADVFRGRIYKQQYWRFLIYENILLSYGISASKEKAKTGFTSYKRPTRILKIWMHNQKIEKKKSIAKKYARYVHVGEKRALSEFPVMKYILKNPDVRKRLKLTEDEIDYLDKE